MKQKTIVAPEAKTKRVDITETEEAESNSILDKLAAHRRALQKYEQKQQFTSPVEELAGSLKGMVGNVKFPGADEAFPHPTQALLRFCSKYYPNAIRGPLYVDHPRNEVEAYRAYERQKVMKKLKIRHIVVEKDSTLEHLLEQLGEF